jgi:hypothetical protein
VVEEAKIESERCIISREVVRAVLSIDDVHRRQRRWPLVQEAAFQAMQLKHLAAEEEQQGRAARRHVPSSARFAPDLCVAQARYNSWKSVSKSVPVESKAVQAYLFKFFPKLERILSAGGDHVLVAGGAVVHAVAAASRSSPTRRPYNSDCDIFLVGLAEHEASAFLSRLCKAAFGDSDNVIFSRNENALTVSMDRGKRFFWQKKNAHRHLFFSFQRRSLSVHLASL